VRIRALVLPVAIVAALLAGCTKDAGTTTPPTPTVTGLAALTGAEIMNKAAEAFSKVTSYHLKGKVVTEGQTVEVDISVVGDTEKGTIVAEGTSIEIIELKDGSYVKSDALFAQMFDDPSMDAATKAALQKTMKGKWLKMAPSESDTILPKPSELFKPGDFGAVAKGDTSTINGMPVIALEDRSGGKVFIALTGEPYPVRVDAGDIGTFDITEIGTVAPFSAPPASEVFDTTQAGK
jgi:hypothetical protein